MHGKSEYEATVTVWFTYRCEARDEDDANEQFDWVLEDLRQRIEDADGVVSADFAPGHRSEVGERARHTEALAKVEESLGPEVAARFAARLEAGA